VNLGAEERVGGRKIFFLPQMFLPILEPERKRKSKSKRRI
jgi:hypothetical protein